MHNTVRTTIRIRKDLLDQSRTLAREQDTTVQNIINDILVKGFSKITDLNKHKQAMNTIDAIREKLSHNKTIDTKALVEENNEVLDDRSRKLL